MPSTSFSSYSKYTGYIRKSILSSSPQRNLYLELLLNLTAVAFFGWFAIRPTIITITDLVREIEIKNQIATQLDQKIDTLLAANTTYKTAAPQLPLLDEALPTDSQVTQFTAQVEQLMRQSAVEFIDFNYQPFPLNKALVTIKKPTPTAAGEETIPDPTVRSEIQWNDLEFDLMVRGTYSELRQLINSLFQMRRVVLTKNIAMQRDSGDKDGNSILNLKLTGKILYF